MQKYEYSITEVVSRIHSTVVGTQESYNDVEWMEKASKWLKWRVTKSWDHYDDTPYACALRCMALIACEESKEWLKKHNKSS